jgi:ribonuclease P/MRP protein subunit POP5
MRDKRRYILVKVFPPWCSPEIRGLYIAIQEAVSSLFGDATGAGIQMAVVHTTGEYAILRCNRGTEKVLMQALPTVFCIGNEPAALRPVATSGTILSLKQRIERDLHRPAPEKRNITCREKLYDAYYYSGLKVDLLEKGFKSRELLFLTEEDIEDK